MDETKVAGSKVGAVAVLAFAVLLFMTVAVVDAPRAATDEAVLAWWSKESNQTAEILSMFFALGAAISFLVFLSVLAQGLRAAEGSAGWISAFVHSSGVAFAGLLLLAGVLRGAVVFSVRFGDEPLPGVDMLRLVPAMSWVLLGSVGLPVAAACIGAASWLILRTGVLGRWIGWVGLAVAGTLLGAVAIGPWLIPLVHLWALPMGVAMWRGGTAVTSRVQASTAAPGNT